MPTLAAIASNESSTADAALSVWPKFMNEAIARASLDVQLVCIPEAGYTGEHWANVLGDKTGYGYQLDEIVKACHLHGFVLVTEEGKTGLGKQFTSDIRNLYTHLIQRISERLEACIKEFESSSPDLHSVSDSTLNEVKSLVSWLSQLDNNTFATVTEDGIIALEASVGVNARLFAEIDRDGAVEAAIDSSESGIQGINGTTISELISEIMVRLVGRS